jgi:hypothetical protein
MVIMGHKNYLEKSNPLLKQVFLAILHPDVRLAVTNHTAAMLILPNSAFLQYNWLPEVSFGCELTFGVHDG